MTHDPIPASPARHVRTIIRYLKIALTVYVPLSFTLLQPPSTFHLVIGFTGAVLALFFMEAALNSSRAGALWNSALAVLSLVVNAYFLVEIDRLSFPMGMPHTSDYIFGVLLLYLVIDASRRSLGWILPGLAIGLAAYVLLGPWMPGALYHPGFSISRTTYQLTGSLQGPYGQIPTVVISVIAIFLIFGGVVQGAGIADFFASLARWISRRARSGTGQTSVVMSSLFGSISGSPVANVGTTGTLTISLMKKAGFRSEEAAAIEGVSSTGSQIIPPVLGTSAFIMAQFLNRPYSDIAAASLFPAMLFIMTISLTVMAIAYKRNTKPLPFEGTDRPSWSKIHLLLPVGLLIWALMSGFSEQYSAFVATVAAVILLLGDTALRSIFGGGKQVWRISISRLLEYLETSANALIMVVIAGAIIGIIVQLLTMPLTIQHLSSVAIELANGNLLIILIVVGVAALILGTGLPTVATYVVVALLFAPTLIALGVDPLAAHMYVFYLGVAGDVTPPTAMAVLIASGIAGANFWRACMVAMRLGFPLFVLPFLFVLQPTILRAPGGWQDWLIYFAVMIGMLASVAAVSGYLFKPIGRSLRGVFLLSTVACFWPSQEPILQIAGIVIFAGAWLAAPAASSGEALETETSRRRA